jgi:hypothetical protein
MKNFFYRFKKKNFCYPKLRKECSVQVTMITNKWLKFLLVIIFRLNDEIRRGITSLWIETEAKIL